MIFLVFDIPVDGTIFLIGALIAAIGPTISVGVLAWINHRAAANARKVAALEKIEVMKQQEANALAQAQALEAAKELVEAAKIQNEQLSHIANTSDATHKIVNSQRTVMLRMVAALARRIATENPADTAAQRAAEAAEFDAQNSMNQLQGA